MTYSLEQIEEAASWLIGEAGNQTIWCLVGEMGAGKTTLIKAVCRSMGVQDELSSPTFSIVNEYLDGNGRPIYHFDLYRIDEEMELAQLGIEEYFDSGNLCLIEWPDRAVNFLPDDYLKINVNLVADNHREIIINNS